MAQINNEYLTQGFANGTYWNMVFESSKEKDAYLKGIADGIHHYSFTAMIELEHYRSLLETLRELSLPSVIDKEFVQELDKFYNNINNIRIPIPAAMQIFAVKTSRFSEGANIDELIRNTQKIYGSIPLD